MPDEVLKTEAELLKEWRLVLSTLHRDLAYVWSPQIQKEISKMKETAGKLDRLLRYMNEDNNDSHIPSEDLSTILYNESRMAVREFVSELGSADASSEWLNKVESDLHDLLNHLNATLPKSKGQKQAWTTRVTNRRRLWSLNQFFPTDFHPNLTSIMLQDWDLAQQWMKMVQRTTKYVRGVKNDPVCRFTLTVERFISEQNWKLFVDSLDKITDVSETVTHIYFYFVLPHIAPILSPDNFDSTIEYLSNQAKHFLTGFAVLYTIPIFRPCLTPQNIEGVFSQLRRMSKYHDNIIQTQLTEFTIPAITHLLSKENIVSMLSDIATCMAAVRSHEAESKLMHSGFLAISPSVTLQDWPEIVRVVKETQKRSGDVLRGTIPIIQEVKKEIPLAKIVDDIIEVNELLDDGPAEYIFGSGLMFSIYGGEQGNRVKIAQIKPAAWPYLISIIKDKKDTIAGYAAWIYIISIRPDDKTLQFLEKNFPDGGDPLMIHGLQTMGNVVSIEDMPRIYSLVQRIQSKYPQRVASIFETIRKIIKAGLVKNVKDLDVIWDYLKSCKIFTINLFREYCAKPRHLRQSFLQTQVQLVDDVVLGKEFDEITEGSFDLMESAIGSANISRNILRETVIGLEEKVRKLPPVRFKPFTLEVGEVSWKFGKMNKGFREGWAEFFSKINKDDESPHQKSQMLTEMFKLFEVPGLKSLQEKACSESEEGEKDKVSLRIMLLYCLAHQANGKQKKIVWSWLVWVSFWSLDEDQRSQILKIGEKTDAAQTRAMYATLIEFFNDTMKDDLLEFGHFFTAEMNDILLEHRTLSELNKFYKEFDKIKNQYNSTSERFRCVPSKKIIDLFYGYMGENCTSKYPEELLNPHFTPFRMITDKNQIEGCIHFLEHHESGRKMLFLVGIEPKREIMQSIEGDTLVDGIFQNAIEQGRELGFDIVGIADARAMTSNRASIRKIIYKKVEKKKRIKISVVNFPEHSIYEFQNPYVLWDKAA